jgi:catechol 2,3-dioxygenase-like lactoylglutathione lyase family enzyme
MLSHVHIGVTDFARAFAFYQGLMDELGFVLRFSEPEKPWAGWMRPGADRPLFLIGHPYHGQRATAGNGQMTRCSLGTAARSTGATPGPSPAAQKTRASRGCGRTITRIITAPISATPTATSCAFAVTIQPGRD